jgi:hypothetical protein
LSRNSVAWQLDKYPLLVTAFAMFNETSALAMTTVQCEGTHYRYQPPTAPTTLDGGMSRISKGPDLTTNQPTTITTPPGGGVGGEGEEPKSLTAHLFCCVLFTAGVSQWNYDIWLYTTYTEQSPCRNRHFFCFAANPNQRISSTRHTCLGIKMSIVSFECVSVCYKHTLTGTWLFMAIQWPVSSNIENLIHDINAELKKNLQPWFRCKKLNSLSLELKEKSWTKPWPSTSQQW